MGLVIVNEGGQFSNKWARSGGLGITDRGWGGFNEGEVV